MANKHVEDTKRKNQRFKNLFNSPDGRAVLDELIAEFDKDELRSTDTHETYFNLGAREVIKHIQFRMRNADED